jgi:hypothetical protein
MVCVSKLLGQLKLFSQWSGPPLFLGRSHFRPQAHLRSFQCCCGCAFTPAASLRIVSKTYSGVQLLGDISTGTFHPLVPAAFRAAIIRSLHNVHHPGVRATVRLVKASYCWPKMSRDIMEAACTCMGCQLGKIHRHVLPGARTHRRISSPLLTPAH